MYDTIIMLHTWNNWNLAALFWQEPVETEDVSKGMYGNRPMIQSASRPDITFLDVSSLTPSQADKKVWIRARLQTSRAKGRFLNTLLISLIFQYLSYFKTKTAVIADSA